MIKIEKRRTPQTSTVILVGVASVVLSLAVSILLLQLMGYNPIQVFSTTFQKTFFKQSGIYQCILLLIPITLCALSVAVAARVGLWNIGVDGQFYIGAIAATGIELAFPNLPAYLLIPLMIIAAAAAAGLLCYLSILPRIYLGISEVLTTILINSIVLYFVNYLVYDAWRTPGNVVAQSPDFINAAILPILIPKSRVHIGLIIALLIAVAVYFLIKSTVFGYEMRAVGENPEGAKYAGISISKYFFMTALLSGCLAGIAGMLEVSGVVHRLQANISRDYGFTSFVIAWVSRLNVPSIFVTGYLFSGLIVAGDKMEILGFPSSVILMLKGLILLFVLAGEVLTFYKITWGKENSKKVEDKKMLGKIEAPEGGH